MENQELVGNLAVGGALTDHLGPSLGMGAEVCDDGAVRE